MGWSCRADAGDTLDKVTAACIESTGMSNVYEAGGGRYFIEVSRKEHDDGAITGSIFKHINETQCRKAGSFRINGNGTVARGPKFLKDAAERPGRSRYYGAAIGSGGMT